MAVWHLLVSFILLIFNPGFSTEDTVFVQTGASVQLDVQRDKLPDKFDEIYWQNEKSDTIVKYYYKFNTFGDDYDAYKHRIDFNSKTFSLTLKNMNKTDNGVYTAKITGKTNKDVAEHRVSVIDPVKTPELTVISNRSSSDSCTVNFTCRAHDLTLKSTYNNDNCYPEEVTSHEKFTLILICSNEYIICNHSNPVSWETDTIDITQLCKGNPGPEINSSTLPVWKVVCIAVGIVVLVLVIISVPFYCWKRNKVYILNIIGTKPNPNTVYAEVNAELPMETVKSDFNPYDVPDQILHQTQGTKEDKQTTTIYHTVGQHLQPEVTAVTDHTIYSQVCKQPPKKPDTTSSNCT